MEIGDRITMTIPQFMTASGLGRSKTYDLIDREIDSVLVDGRRVIIVQSYLDYLERQKQAQAAGVGRIPSPNPRAKSGDGRTASPAVSYAAPPTRRSPRGRSPKYRRSRSLT